MQETKECVNCKNDFTIFPLDRDFYAKFDVPEPTFCPECRMLRRLVLRNERALYKRKCMLCGKDEILIFSPESPYIAYCFTCWWSDNWDPKSSGREYNFSRTFFEQFHELLLAVPRPGKVQQGNCVNSFYTNRASDLKDSYLSFSCNVGEQLQYCCRTNESKECTDCFGANACERCYECIDCSGCYDLTYSRECVECTSSSLLVNCRNCQDCFGCVNLRGQNYYIFNEPYSREEYKKKVAEITASPQSLREARERVADLEKNTYVPWAMMHQSSGCTGNWIDGSKNVTASFDVKNMEDGRYLFGVQNAKDGMDYCLWGAGSERIYEGVGVGRQCANVKFSSECWNQLRDSEYCMNCHNSHDLFGCVGLRNAEYCIFNTQYTKEEYEALVPKIKAQMNEMPYRDARGILYGYGEFFPVEHSPFAYNESVAQEYFRKTPEETAAFGSRWQKTPVRSYGITLAPEDVPKKIELVTDAITKEIIGCRNKGLEETMCTTAFRVVPEELAMYRKMHVQIPEYCPNCRHFARQAQRTPMKLWQRSCMCEQDNHDHQGICPNEFETSYAPERPEIVYCESCYQKEVV